MLSASDSSALTGGNFLPTPGFAQVWGNRVWKWLLYTDFRAGTETGDKLRSTQKQSVDAHECGDYSVILYPNLRRVEASAASGGL
jgi:hypothetical protein